MIEQTKNTALRQGKVLVKFFLFIAGLMLAFPVLSSVEITVSVDRNPVNLDESFHLFFTAAEQQTRLQKEKSSFREPTH